MAVYRVNATRGGALCSVDGETGWRSGLTRLLFELPDGAPVTILIHGYRFTWRPEIGGGCFCPHRRLYRTRHRQSRARRPLVSAWPTALGFSETAVEDGLCIAFGWDARVKAKTLGLTGLGDFREIHKAAEAAGTALAALVGAIAEAAPQPRVTLLAHSLGARVALTAMAKRPDLPFGRAVFMGAAERQGLAWRALDALDRARSAAEVYHMMSRANDFFDAAFDAAAPDRPDGRALGVAGLGAPDPRWLDIELDHPATVDWLASRGTPLERPIEAVSHWHFYADRGAMGFYRQILRGAPQTDLASLRRAGLEGWRSRRWSRLIPAIPRQIRPNEERPGLGRAFAQEIGPDITEA